MSLAEILERVEKLDGVILLAEGRPCIRPPCNNPTAARELRELAPQLGRFRDSLVRILSEVPDPVAQDLSEDRPPIVCSLCRSLWYCPMSEVVRLANDPHW